MIRFISNRSGESFDGPVKYQILMTKYTFLWCAENGEGQSGKCIISIIICYSEASKENEITQVTEKSVLDRSGGKVQISGNSQESNLSHVCLFRKSTGTAGFVLFFQN